MGGAIAGILWSIGNAYWQTFYACMFCFGLELIWPKGEGCTFGARLRGASFWFVNGALVVSFTTLFMMVLGRLHFPPLLTLGLGQFSVSSNPLLRTASPIVAPVVAVMIGDFFAYWLHRSLHRVPALWRIHRLHHSVRELSAWTSYSHFAEGMLHAPFVALPLAWLIHPEVGPASAIVMVILGLQGFFQHACTSIHLGPLRHLVSDNRFHRIHHSIDPEHHNRNFGNFTTVWDRVFGTAHFPEPDEWPDTGLADIPQPETLRDYALQPVLPAIVRSGAQA